MTELPTAAEMIETLTRAGCRITRQRSVIIDHLAGRSDHPSARRIYDALAGRETGLSLATVYNTLATLARHGLIRAIDFDGTDNRYDTNPRPHINLHCTVCDAIVDLDRELPVTTAEILEATGFETTVCRIEYRGRCAVCRANGRDPR